MSGRCGEVGEPVASFVGVAEPDYEWQRFDARIVAVWRMRTLLVSVVVLAFVGPFTLLAGSSHRFGRGVGTAALGLVSLTVTIAMLRLVTVPLRYRLARWSLDPCFVQIETGWWRTMTERVPIDRVHTMVVSQGPFLRRFGLFQITLHASAGSGLLVLAGLTVDDVAEVRHDLGFER